MSGPETEYLTPVTRRSMRVIGTAAGAASTGSNNTNVIAFIGVPFVTQGTPYPLSLLNQAPVTNSGTWINAVNSATDGSTFKCLRQGIYLARLTIISTPGDTLGYQWAISIDCAAAQLTVAAGTFADTNTALVDSSSGVGAATIGIAIKTFGTVYITKAQASSAAAALPVAGVGGAGVIRFHGNNNANAALATQATVARTRAEIEYHGDMAG